MHCTVCLSLILKYFHEPNFSNQINCMAIPVSNLFLGANHVGQTHACLWFCSVLPWDLLVMGWGRGSNLSCHRSLSTWIPLLAGLLTGNWSTQCIQCCIGPNRETSNRSQSMVVFSPAWITHKNPLAGSGPCELDKNNAEWPDTAYPVCNVLGEYI